MSAPTSLPRPTADLVLEARRLALSSRIRDALRLIIAAPRLVHVLLDELDQLGMYALDQMRRRDADYRDLVGRRSVEIEAAARAGYNQALAHAGYTSPDRYTAFDLPAVLRVVAEAKPREVLGAMNIQRAGVQ